MAAQALRSPFDDLDEEDAGSEPETFSDSSSDEYEVELQSMTGKGIKRLCSELLELKKASEEDFLKAVYSNYPTFIRAFKELGVVERELTNLRQHVSIQKKLVQALSKNLSVDIECDDSADSNTEETDEFDIASVPTHMDDVLEKLDVLLSEHQVDEALLLLQMETLNLQKLQRDVPLSPYVQEYTFALSDKRTLIADKLASVAEHPRVAAAELHKALCELCSLGEEDRANSLLLNYYRSRLSNRVHELQCSKHFLHGTYVMEHCKIVFSLLSQAARSLVFLYGETSPYTSELIQWVREETEALSYTLIKFVKSVCEKTGGFPAAVEAVKAAIAFCSLLKSQRIIMQPDLMKLIRPCMEDALHMHVEHLQKVIDAFTTTDTWALGKLSISGALADKPSLKMIDSKLQNCLISSSGRKFVTLLQATVDDISPLIILQMGSPILEVLARLFNVYIRTLERAIPSRTDAAENDIPRISTAQKLPQQLSVLVTSSTILRLFPSIASGVFSCIRTLNNEPLPNHVEHSFKKELNKCMLSLEELYDQLRSYFCQQFVNNVMSDGEYRWKKTWESSADVQHKPHLLRNLVPSLALQEFFLRLRKLETLSKSALVGEERMLEKLLKDLMKAMIVWLSKNLDFWKGTEHGSGQCSCFEQFQLDMDFLVEIARLGGYFSDDVVTAVMDLLSLISNKFTDCGSDTKGAIADDAIPDDEWFSNAAKLAIEKLLDIEVNKSERTGESTASCAADTGDFIAGSEDSADSDNGESAGSIEQHATETEINAIVLNSPRAKVVEDYDESSSTTTTPRFIGIEDAKVRGRDDAGSVQSNRSEGVEEQDIHEFLITPMEETVWKLEKSIAGAAKSSTWEKPIDVVEMQDLALKFDFLEVSDNLERDALLALRENRGIGETGKIKETEETKVEGIQTVTDEDSVEEQRDIAGSQTLGLTFHSLEVSDELDDDVFHATRGSTKTFETYETKDSEEAVVKRISIFHSQEAIANLDEHSSGDKPISITKMQNLETEFKFLEISDIVDSEDLHATGQKIRTAEASRFKDEEQPDLMGLLFDPKEKLDANIDLSVNKSTQLVRQKSIGLSKFQNMASKFELLGVSDTKESKKSGKNKVKTETVEISEIKEMQKSDVKGLMNFSENEPAWKLDVAVSETARSINEKPIVITKTQNPRVKSELELFDDLDTDASNAAHTSENEGAGEPDLISFLDEESFGKLNISRASESATAKPTAIFKPENDTQVDKFVESFKNLEVCASEFDSTEERLNVLAENPGDVCSTGAKISTKIDEKNADLEKLVAVESEEDFDKGDNSSTNSEELGLDNQIKKMAMGEVQGDEGEKLLSSHGKSIVRGKSSGMQDEEKANDLSRPKRKRELPKSVCIAERLGKTKRGTTTSARPRWT